MGGRVEPDPSVYRQVFSTIAQPQMATQLKYNANSTHNSLGFTPNRPYRQNLKKDRRLK
ncbi:hypothetical protein CKA32_000996 [Geitlerinema sp. FC II]|nr:hypothetical protein CKA32_000996 [Geitlerinema sp. FC II]